MSYKTRFGNKFGAKKTTFNGRKHDSKFEASVAKDLFLRKEAGDILDYDCQFKVEMDVYNKHGVKVHQITHKVDFRTHNLDGTFTLIEAKGVETADYRFRRKCLEKIWLPENLDHTYEVVYQSKRIR